MIIQGESRDIMIYFIFCGSFLVITTHIFLVKIFKIEDFTFFSKEKKASHKWWEAFLTGLLVPSTVFALIIDAFSIYYILIVFLISHFFLRTYMNWKHERGSNHYILDLHCLVIMIILFFVIRFTHFSMPLFFR